MSAALTQNKDLMEEARDSLRGKWGLGAAVFLVAYAIPLALVSGFDYAVSPEDPNQSPFGSLAYLLVSPAIQLGVSIFFLALIRGRDPRFSVIFEGFPRFLTALAIFALMMLYIVLWALLLIIPGFIAMLSYSLAYFVLADDPSIGANAAIRRSKELMRGRKWKLFKLLLRFLGWFLLGLLTLGIAFFWIVPYYLAALAHFYEDVKGAESPEAVLA